MAYLRFSWLRRAQRAAAWLALWLSWAGMGHTAPVECDLVVYGGTAAGVMAAVEGTRLGKSVVLIEPTRRLGGLTSGGLGQTDIGNKAAIGGLAREFYRAIRRHYEECLALAGARGISRWWSDAHGRRRGRDVDV